jgi:hypothetical protein
MSALQPASPRARKKRTTLTIATRVAIAKAWAIDKARDVPLKTFVRLHNIQLIQVKRWVKQLPELEEAAKRVGSNRTTTNIGRKSILEPYKAELFQWLFETRQGGMAVSTRMFAITAARLDNEYRRKLRGILTVYVPVGEDLRMGSSQTTPSCSNQSLQLREHLVDECRFGDNYT